LEHPLGRVSRRIWQAGLVLGGVCFLLEIATAYWADCSEAVVILALASTAICGVAMLAGTWVHWEGIRRVIRN